MSQTGTTTSRVIHFMGNAHIQNTACERYVRYGSALVVTAERGSVTCKQCLNAMA